MPKSHLFSPSMSTICPSFVGRSHFHVLQSLNVRQSGRLPSNRIAHKDSGLCDSKSQFPGRKAQNLHNPASSKRFKEHLISDGEHVRKTSVDLALKRYHRPPRTTASETIARGRSVEQPTMTVGTGSNWFTSWEEGEESGKSFLLQVSLEGVTNPSLIHDSVNAYVRLQRSTCGVGGPWEEIGNTETVENETDPEYAAGFRILYTEETDLTKDVLRAQVFHKHDTGLQSDEKLGEADVTLNEMLRTFGTKLMVELLKPKKDKIAGRIWFHGEALPLVSPRGGHNLFDFRIKMQTPPSDVCGDAYDRLGASRMFLVVSRERPADGSWAVVHRTGYVKKGSTRVSRKIHSHLKSYLMVPRFRLLQTNLILGGTLERQIRVQVFMKGRKDEGHSLIGTSVFTVDELLKYLRSDTCVDFTKDEDIIGEFAVIQREEASQKKAGTRYKYEVEINFEDEKEIAEKVRKVQKRNMMRLDDI